MLDVFATLPCFIWFPCLLEWSLNPNCNDKLIYSIDVEIGHITIENVQFALDKMALTNISYLLFLCMFR